jgi:hypothetical protein
MYRALDSPGPIVPVVSVVTDAMLSGPGAAADSAGLDGARAGFGLCILQALDIAKSAQADLHPRSARGGARVLRRVYARGCRSRSSTTLSATKRKPADV